jgi:hypothetical protein
MSENLIIVLYVTQLQQMLCDWPTPWGRVPLEKPGAPEVVKLVFCGARRFITAFTSACVESCSEGHESRLNLSQHFVIRFSIILPSTTIIRSKGSVKLGSPVAYSVPGAPPPRPPPPARRGGGGGGGPVRNIPRGVRV